jgi:hypothetical protein
VMHIDSHCLMDDVSPSDFEATHVGMKLAL